MKCFLSFLVLLTLVSDTFLASVKAQENYVLVFADEFNQKNGSQPDAKFWSSSPRGRSLWNRWISDSKEVAFIKSGRLVCRAIRNTVNPADTALMLTGAVETRNKFSFKYGKIEVRAKTNLHVGNFPAIWLLPQPPAQPHPYSGEIDICETFGTHKDAYQTAHSHWTVDLNHRSPKNGFVKNGVSVNRWHVYSLEWSEDNLVFKVDGEVTGVYLKSKDKEALENGQWPFDHPFYIILNQSVMVKNSRAGALDLNYVYETQFDWVRVYKKKQDIR
jgi:beta-glucanase (GH16 family)